MQAGRVVGLESIGCLHLPQRLLASGNTNVSVTLRWAHTQTTLPPQPRHATPLLRQASLQRLLPLCVQPVRFAEVAPALQRVRADGVGDDETHSNLGQLRVCLSRALERV